MMQQVMGNIGQNPGLLGRIPGFKQLGQLSKMKNMDLGSMFGGGQDSKLLEQAMAGGGMPGMQMPQLAPGYTPPIGRAEMAKARLAGYSMGPQVKPKDDRERDALKERRKRERQAKKKNRKKK